MPTEQLCSDGGPFPMLVLVVEAPGGKSLAHMGRGIKLPDLSNQCVFLRTKVLASQVISVSIT